MSLGGTALVTAKGGSGAPAPDSLSCLDPGGAGGGFAVGAGVVPVAELTVAGGSGTPNGPGTIAGAGGNSGEAGGGGDGGSSSAPQHGASGNAGAVIVTFSL